jgi:hypothetical protein
MKKSILLLLTSIWLGAVGYGVGILTVYEDTPGRASRIPTDWPSQSLIPLAQDRPTLVMFAHPECPCTRASVGELAELMSHCQNRVTAHVVFLYPKGTSEEWLHTDLWRSAEAIPGVLVQADEDAIEAAHFEATTSGQVVLYDASGKLLFRGGITSSRGHYGDNLGLSAITALVNGEMLSARETPVFGCPLLDPSPDCLRGSTTCKR